MNVPTSAQAPNVRRATRPARSFRGSRPAIAALVLGLAVLGACSSKTEEPAASGSTGAPSQGGAVPSIEVKASGENKAFCDGFASVTKAIINAGGQSDPDRARSQMGEAKRSYAALVAIAPAAVKPDVEAANTGLAEVETPAQALTMAGPSREASDRVVAWVATNCGFDPGNLG